MIDEEYINMNKTVLRRGGRRGVSHKTKRKLAIGILLASGALAAAATASRSSPMKVSTLDMPSAVRNVDRLIPLAPIEIIKPKKIRFVTGDVDSKTFKSLNSYYVGKARVEIDWDNVDLAQNLRFMWRRKQATFNVTPAVRKSVAAIISQYERQEHDTTDLKAFIRRVDHVVNDTRSSIDWPALCEDNHLSSDRCVRLQYLAGRITGRSIVAYGMTELFPSRDGDTNKKMLDVMLRRAGTDYLDAIPALGDKYLSMGLYQFTSFAVRHDKDGRQGANIIARYGHSLPGSVMQLHGDDQHRAAFYFATYNLMRLVGMTVDETGARRSVLNSRQYANLKAHAPIKEIDLTIFMAASHHLPSGARRAMAAWLQEGCTRPLKDYLRGDLPVYGAKSAANFAALS